MGHLFFQTIPTKVLPRHYGITTFMRLSHIEFNDMRIANVVIGLIGVPMDNGS